ncbi:hypothetical protein [Pseudomonas citronellolis]|uniref:hypothetical protein n=1 Tax=Pseudomonas citronellolis TaxID=53408 RepID=UPI003C2D4381
MSATEKPDPVKDAKVVAAEVRSWERYLNEVTGFVGFTLAIAALGTPAPQFWGVVSLVFLFAFHYTLARNEMSRLRELDRKKNKTEYEIWLARQIRKTISPLRTPVFWLGFGVLLIVALGPDLFGGNEWLLKNLYGEDASYARGADFLKKICFYILPN